MTKNMTKAIRLVNGYTDDLRVKMCDNVHISVIQEFLEHHSMELFGVNPDTMPDLKRERFFRCRAWNVCAGLHD